MAHITFSHQKMLLKFKNIGADIIMPLDECTPYPCNYKYAKQSMDRTHRWLKRCLEEHYKSPPKYEHEQTLFPIVKEAFFQSLEKNLLILSLHKMP